jgi:hypothetical protein
MDDANVPVGGATKSQVFTNGSNRSRCSLCRTLGFWREMTRPMSRQRNIYCPDETLIMLKGSSSVVLGKCKLDLNFEYQS